MSMPVSGEAYLASHHTPPRNIWQNGSMNLPRNYEASRSHKRRVVEGLVCLVLFALTIPVANWMIGHVGTVCPPQSPCLIPVAPGLMAPSGVVMIGLALVLRDLVQRRLGLVAAFGAILLGAALSAFLAPPSIVVASAAAFLLSEMADLFVYTPLQRRGFLRAVLLSSLVGLLVDSAVFLHLAFGSLEFFLGQVVGKAWMVLLAIPFVGWLRRRDERLGLMPA
jgi:queuosine precursor transporter